MIFRVATSADLSKLAELEQAVIDAERPFNEAIKDNGAQYYDLPFLLEDTESQLLVVEDEGVLVGAGYVQLRTSKKSLVHERHGYLGFMYVAPSYRGKGLNKQVIEHLIVWAKSRGVCDFYLDVYGDNQAAVKAYEKLGFTSSLVEMKLHL